MELPIRAPGDGVVAAVRCREGELVQADARWSSFVVNCRTRSPSSKSGPRDGLQNESARVVDRRQDRVRQPAERGGAAGDRGVARSSARNGCRRWRTPPRCSPASRARRASATRRSCRISPGSIARSRRASPKSRCSPRRPKPSAGRTSTRASTSRWRRTSRCASARIAAGLRVRGYLSTAFGCPFEGDGRAGTGRRRRRAARATSACSRSAISDTIGIAHPGQVPRVLDAVLARLPVDRHRAAFPRHARHGARQRAGGAALRHRDVRRVGRRPRRLPVRARRRRQPGHRRSDLHAGRVGDRNRSVADRPSARRRRSSPRRSTTACRRAMRRRSAATATSS